MKELMTLKGTTRRGFISGLVPVCTLAWLGISKALAWNFPEGGQAQESSGHKFDKPYHRQLTFRQVKSGMLLYASAIILLPRDSIPRSRWSATRPWLWAMTAATTAMFGTDRKDCIRCFTPKSYRTKVATSEARLIVQYSKKVPSSNAIPDILCCKVDTGKTNLFRCVHKLFDNGQIELRYHLNKLRRW